MHYSIWATRGWRIRSGRWQRAAVIASGLLCIGGCHDGASASDTAPPSATASAKAPPGKDAGSEDGEPKQPAGEGVTLTPDQVATLGLVTQPAAHADYREEALGYGVVLAHDSMAQAAAELATAQATARLSRGALERARKLAGTPGAVSADVEESAAEKAAVDAAALTLTVEKLSSTLGMNPPWSMDGKSATLRDLASGRVKLLRTTFPLGALSGTAPATLRASRLGTAAPGSGWNLRTIWGAPADATIPGRSFFALLAASDAVEGERLRVWAPVGAPTAGVLVPAAAAVLHDGQYWCYVEKKPGTFVRREIDIARPMVGGYFVSQGVAPGDKVVITAAGLLLAKEAGPAAETD